MKCNSKSRKGIPQIKKSRAVVKTGDRQGDDYLIPDSRTWTVQYWRDLGKTVEEIAEIMGLSLSTVQREMRIMRDATSASLDPQQIRRSLLPLAPRAIRGLFKDIDRGNGNVALGFLKGIQVMSDRQEVDSPYLNMTASEVIKLFVAAIADNPELKQTAIWELAALDEEFNETKRLTETGIPEYIARRISAEREARAKAKGVYNEG